MKKEDIEKAVFYGCDKNVMVLDSWDEKVYKDGFQDGAKWRINSIWHDVKEEADISKEITVMYPNKSCRIFLPFGRWKTLIELDKFIKWAYVEDLLPNIKD